MGQKAVEELVGQAVTLFIEDTVFTGLGVMQQHGLGRVAVVHEHSGELVGEVSVEDLYRAWATDPFMSVGQVLSRSPRPGLHQAQA